ncbi:uncharacterized protein ACNLHF_007605 [Anomaloglossus baeobatrachus]
MNMTMMNEQNGSGKMGHLLISLMVMIIFFELSTSFPDGRVGRHADGLFTSELSKMKNDIAMRYYLKSLLTSKRRDLRSDTGTNILEDLNDNETRPEKDCINWIYQNFPSEKFV